MRVQLGVLQHPFFGGEGQEPVILHKIEGSLEGSTEFENLINEKLYPLLTEYTENVEKDKNYDKRGIIKDALHTYSNSLLHINSIVFYEDSGLEFDMSEKDYERCLKKVNGITETHHDIDDDYSSGEEVYIPTDWLKYSTEVVPGLKTMKDSTGGELSKKIIHAIKNNLKNA